MNPIYGRIVWFLAGALIGVLACMFAPQAMAQDAEPAAVDAPAEVVAAPEPQLLTIKVEQSTVIHAPKVLHIDGTVACRVDEDANLHCTARKAQEVAQ